MRSARPALGVLAALAASVPATAQSLAADVFGPVVGESFGTSIRPCGDLNSDGVPDLVVGCPLFSGWIPLGGCVRIVSGEWLRETALGNVPSSQPLLYVWGADYSQTPRFGHAVAGGGDVDGDGVPDIAAGAPGDDRGGLQAGAVRVFSGATYLELTVVLGNPVDLFGTSLCFVGDVNQDGHDDLLVGAPGSVATWSSFEGYATVLSGEWIAKTALGQTPLTTRSLYEVHGIAGADQLGESVSRLRDLDGDGVDELVLGAPHGWSDHRGYALVVSGRTGTLLDTKVGLRRNDFLGFSHADAGDVDGDGFADLVVGSMGYDRVPNVNTMEGRVLVYSGEWIARTAAGQMPTTPEVLHELVGTGERDRLGWSIAGPGDVDGDGVPDVVVATLRDEARGMVQVLSGRTWDLVRTHRSDEPGTRFGFALAALGDLDGNGAADFAVTAPNGGIGGSVRAVFSWGTATCTATPNSTGRGAVLVASGSPRFAVNDLELHARDLPPGTLATFFGGRSALPPTGLFDGYVCISPTGLYRLRTTRAGPSGHAVCHPDLTRPPDPADPMSPGTTWTFQAFYRDPGFGAGANFTGGWRFTFAP